MRRFGHEGFSLTELLIAMVISLVVSLSAWGFYRSQLNALTDQSRLLDANEGARAAMGFMARELRRAGFDQKETALTTTGARGVSEARSDRLLIQWDANKSGSIDTSLTDPDTESVLYTYDATTQSIVRTVAGLSQTLIKNVPAGGLSFQYFKSDGTALTPTGTPAELGAADRDDVAIILLKLRVRTIRDGQYVIADQAARATLRNRILDRL